MAPWGGERRGGGAVMALPLELTPEERQALRRQARRAIGRVSERIHFVLLNARGYSPALLAAIAAAIAAAPDAPRLYEDECDLHQVPVVRGQYQRRGEQREIATPGVNRKQPVFGFLEARTGEWHYWLLARKRSVEFLICLHARYQWHPSGPILLLLDNCTTHKS